LNDLHVRGLVCPSCMVYKRDICLRKNLKKKRKKGWGGENGRTMTTSRTCMSQGEGGDPEDVFLAGGKRTVNFDQIPRNTATSTLKGPTWYRKKSQEGEGSRGSRTVGPGETAAREGDDAVHVGPTRIGGKIRKKSGKKKDNQRETFEGKAKPQVVDEWSGVPKGKGGVGKGQGENEIMCRGSRTLVAEGIKHQWV